MNTLFLYTKIIGLDICTQTLKKKKTVLRSQKDTLLLLVGVDLHMISNYRALHYHVNVRAIFSRWQVDNSD